MFRISTNLPNDNMQYHARRREHLMNQAQNQMAAQSRIQNLRDAPLAAAHSTRYQSYLARLNRFADNIRYAQDNYRVAEGYMKQGVDMLQRIRELAIQGATGTYSGDDLRHMANEIDELLREFVEIANGRNADGTMLFAGKKSKTVPFRVIEGNVEGASGAVITTVDYVGDIGERMTEIAENSYIELNFPGNQVFWAENQQIYSSVDSDGYTVAQDGVIYIDDVPIELTAGDNVFSIISKINDSPAAVRARLDPVQNSLVLETTSPHQIWVQDGEGSAVLQDLGIVVSSDITPPGNVAPTATVFGGSLFDSIITLRNALYNGDSFDVGGGALRGIDSALDNLLSNLGRLGAKDARLEHAYLRTEFEIPQIGKLNSNEVDIDMAEAITNLRMLEYTHRAALATAARVIQPTLLDFLR
ncbi:MAG: flagellar hook-associated protein 3 [Spirochaetaceae bacterium]|nr:MAG: flagellar hook-associated protein 3 [Spirochaetaceae bacterium]